MMALMNSWDLKDENNEIRERDSDQPRKIDLVSDLGATFGTTGYSWTQTKAKGNLKSYTHTKFIKKEDPEFVDFNVLPGLIFCISFISPL